MGKKFKYERLMNFFKNSSDRGTYLSGSTREGFTIPKGGKLYIFPNEFKNSNNHPDFNLCVKKEEEE